MFRNTLIIVFVLFVTVALFAQGNFGNNLVLNGDQQYLEIPDADCPELANANKITVELRFKTEESHAYNLINKWRYYPGTENNGVISGFKGHGWLLDFNRSSSENRGKMELRYRDPLDAFFTENFITHKRANVKEGGAWGCSSSGGRQEISQNRWHHVAFILNFSSGTIYIDGSYAQSSHSSNSDNTVPGTSLNIGGFMADVAATLEGDSYFNGTIDEVRIWNVVRSSAQISSNMNKPLDPTIYESAESGLIGYYQFAELENLGVGDDGLANDVRDLSVSQNHANVWNGAQLSDPSLQSKVDQNITAPVEFSLHQNYPNPFNPTTTIKFDLPEASPVQIKIYDIQGRLVSTLYDTQLDAGSHSIEWGAANLASGVYICHLEANNSTKIMKMVLQK
jgi:hypothetical protein